VLAGEVKDILLLDVTPLTLGVETLGGVMTPLIPRNTTIPTAKSEIFSTASDNQPSVEVHILQGERPMAADNRTLGRFHLDGIAPAPRGVPQIEVTFDIDANGILNVAAKDKATGKEQKVTITASSGLSKEEVERMKAEAEAHAGEDAKKKELVEAKNQAESLVHMAEKSLKELGDKVKPELKREVEDAITSTRTALAGSDLDKVKAEQEKLNTVMQKMGEDVYRQGSADESKAAETDKSTDGNESSTEEEPKK